MLVLSLSAADPTEAREPQAAVVGSPASSETVCERAHEINPGCACPGCACRTHLAELEACDVEEGLFDNLTFLAALNGSKQPQDLGVNAQFGARVAANWGLPVWREGGLGLQVGTSIDPLYQAVAVLDRLDISDDRFQNFTTVGLYQRTERGWVWGVAHDFLYENYWANFHLSQWRGVAALEWGENNEVGTWFAIRDKGDTARLAGQTFDVEAITQGSIYWRHWFENRTQATVWVGVADGHGAFVLAFPDGATVSQRALFGADVRVPLTDWAAIFGEANFIAPFDSGTVDAYLGIELFPRRNAASVRRFAPVLSVASNPTFAVDLRRR